MGPPQPGDPAPELELPATSGEVVRLSALRGSFVVLHFTATWCPFCDAEVEHFGKLADRYASRNVKAVLVDVQEDAATFGAYAKAHVAPSVIAVRDEDGAVSRRYAPPRAQPAFEDRAQAVLDGTLIIDPEGRIRLFLLPDSAHFDPTFAAVQRELDGLLGQAHPSGATAALATPAPTAPTAPTATAATPAASPASATAEEPDLPPERVVTDQLSAGAAVTRAPLTGDTRSHT